MASVSMQQDQWERGNRFLKNCTDADTWLKAKWEKGKLQSCLHLTVRTRNNLPWQDHFIVDFLWLTENGQWKSIIYSSTYTDQHSDHIYNLSHNSASLQVVLLLYNCFNFEVLATGPQLFLCYCCCCCKRWNSACAHLEGTQREGRAALILHLCTKWG